MLSNHDQQTRNTGDPLKSKPKWQEDLWKYLLTTLLIPGIIYAGILFFSVKPVVDELLKKNVSLTADQKTINDDISSLNNQNKETKEQQEKLNKNLSLQLDSLHSESLKTAYLSLAGIYNQKLNQLNSDSPSSEFEILSDLRLELISLAEQIVGEKEKTSVVLFNEKTRESVSNLYSSIFQADLTRFLEGLIWKVYGRLGTTELYTITRVYKGGEYEVELELSPVEKAFIDASESTDSWFQQTVGGMTTDHVQEVISVFSKLDILKEDADKLELDDVLSKYNDSLTQNLPDIVEMTFVELAGKPRLQLGVYLALHDSGLLDLNKALFVFGDIATNKKVLGLQKQIFDDNMNPISIQELQELADRIKAKLINDLDEGTLTDLFEEQSNNLDNSLLSQNNSETVYDANTVEEFFVEALRWAVKSSTDVDFCDRLKTFLGNHDQQCRNSNSSNVSNDQSSIYIQALEEFETLYRIAEAKAFSASFQQPKAEQ
jgi:hypothetical protein